MEDRINGILNQMAEDAWEAVQFVEQAGLREDFLQKPLYQKAVAMCIINIGGLIKQLPEQYKLEHSSVEWRRLAGMWDVTSHGYHLLDKETLWQVVKTGDIPPLLDFLCDYLR